MVTRTARCGCGALSVICEGEPVRVSVCHCLACQRRSGSAFAVQARFPEARVTVEGPFEVWTRTANSGRRSTQRFCPTCGSTLLYDNPDTFPGVVAVPVGAFADPGFPAPRFSVYEQRRHEWTAVLGADVQHVD